MLALPRRSRTHASGIKLSVNGEPYVINRLAPLLPGRGARPARALGCQRAEGSARAGGIGAGVGKVGTRRTAAATAPAAAVGPGVAVVGAGETAAVAETTVAGAAVAAKKVVWRGAAGEGVVVGGGVAAARVVGGGKLTTRRGRRGRARRQQSPSPASRGDPSTS